MQPRQRAGNYGICRLDGHLAGGSVLRRGARVQPGQRAENYEICRPGRWLHSMHVRKKSRENSKNGMVIRFF